MGAAQGGGMGAAQVGGMGAAQGSPNWSSEQHVACRALVQCVLLWRGAQAVYGKRQKVGAWLVWAP